MSQRDTKENQPGPTVRLHSVPEVATALGLSRWTIYNMLDSGEIAGVYQRGRRYVTDEALTTYVQSLSSTPPVKDAS